MRVCGLFFDFVGLWDTKRIFLYRIVYIHCYSGTYTHTYIKRVFTVPHVPQSHTPVFMRVSEIFMSHTRHTKSHVLDFFKISFRRVFFRSDM